MIVLALPEVRRAAVSLAAFAVAVPAQLAGAPVAVTAAAWLVCYVAGGWEPAWSGLRALRAGSLDVDLLMIVAALAAAAIGQYFDGGLLVVIFATSGALEAAMTARTRAGIEALLDLAPETATRLGPDGERQVPARDLRVGDVVLVRPGERVPADGAVLDGASEVDTASLTGEPLSRPVGPGAAVHAGTVNGTGSLRVRVTADPAEWLVAGIRAQVEQAGETKSHRQLLIERIEQPYSVGVVAVALALVVVPLLFGVPFEPTLLRAMTFMIVASPCAVVLATMPPLLAAIAAASRRGVLLKDATVVEALGGVDAVALDKTGTVTAGTPRVAEVVAHDGDADRLVALAAAAEAGSEHALGRAVREEADRRGLAVPPARGFAAMPGLGVRAVVAGAKVVVGRPALLADPETAADDSRGVADVDLAAVTPGSAPDRVVAPGAPLREPAADPDAAGLLPGCGSHPRRPARPVAGEVPGVAVAVAERDMTRVVVDRIERAGATAVVVLVDGAPAGVLGLADVVRPGAAEAVGALTELTGRTPTLLTGDAPRPAAAVASELRITDVRAGLLPADKAAVVAQWRVAGRTVLAAGDGVNDAPLLATADVGLAVGHGASALSVQAADGVLLRDPMADLPALIVLARRANRVARANLAFAGAVVVALVGWDLFGTLPLVLGVAGHELSTVLVCLNGLRLAAGSRVDPAPVGVASERSDEELCLRAG